MTRSPTTGMNGAPVAVGDIVVAADPDDDEMAICGTLVRQHGRWFVAASGGRLVPVKPAQVQKV